ncbi:helix-turn-helix domain-containing protein [Brevibacillus porteri]|uniref:Helix-turn-helix domain-containing protein n=1 Tax=Brevibacillus porteri TaxID=2126350 RepID=A0ABX5FSD0_9BACL|nr:helix-turn-helix domain-containing protein [Brevibacillus porteri]MED1802881.1 helix-turn-helix domain-containing protein [Brevibacillus porteri]MED2135318.1 helix-turn-helix domain-containing protein [Brevibacillus porteri]MED2748563.1 helix-turn-helix domain-containing protein [Brevibacillus porteri]MED2812578.1 helix-turn-helix domain-containing protein [Brevibacillus porteri]MED2894636.1 helix-turn-helix domain-containing protein [Brevibacillus porteri]
MAKKGQKFNHYPQEMKAEAIRLHVEEGWTYRRIMDHLGIPDRHRLKVWMKKYKQLGEFGLLDQRGRREDYLDQDRYIQKLKRENVMLKKCLKIWMQEVYVENTRSSKRQKSGMV